MTQMKYKLTDQNLRTYMGFQWVVGEWVDASGELDQSLCSDGWIHFYDDPLLAVFFNPIHANIDKPRLWEIETDGDTKVDATKGGARRARLLTELPLSLISLSQRVEIAIRCVLTLHSEPNFVIWAENWLNGTNRTKAAAAKAAAAWTWAEAAAWSAACSAEAEAAWSATRAAQEAAMWAAKAATAEAAMWAAKAATAEAVMWAAKAVAKAAKEAEAHQVLDILAVIKQVVG
jgi:hypothetical protein